MKLNQISVSAYQAEGISSRDRLLSHLMHFPLVIAVHHKLPVKFFLNFKGTLMFIPTHPAAALNVSITIDYTPPPNAVLGENEYRAASSILLTCEVEGAEGAVTYSWVTTLGEGSEDQIRESILGSEDTGNHTCMAVDSTGNSGSATIEISVVGKCYSVLCSKYPY